MIVVMRIVRVVGGHGFSNQVTHITQPEVTIESR